jgi:hypothetical protein
MWRQKMMKLSKIVAACIVSVVVSGCSVSHTKVVVAPEVTENGEAAAFVRLVTYLRSNTTSTPTKEMVDNANFLVFESGLHKECVDGKCYLIRQVNRARIVIMPDYIHIDMPNQRHYKIEDATVAVNVIYS